MNSIKTILLKTGPIHFSQALHNASIKDPSIIPMIRKSFYHHRAKNWKAQHPSQKRFNQDAIQHGGQIVTTHNIKDSSQILIITEACNSFTTIYLHSEY